MRCKILCVDDDSGILEGYSRVLRSRHDVYLAQGPQQGLVKMEGGLEFAVVVTDMRMPGMDGVEFLRRAREICPRARRIVLSGDSERETVVRAVNVGGVQAFLTKPCPAPMLVEAVERACKEWLADEAAIQADAEGRREVLRSLQGMVRAADPVLHERSLRIRDLVRALLAEGNEAMDWQTEAACLLSQAGLLYQGQALRDKIEAGKPLNLAEEEAYAGHGHAGADLVAGVPGYGPVAAALRWQRSPFDPDVVGPEPMGNGLPRASRLLRLAADADWFAGAGGFVQVMVRLKARAYGYDPELMRRLEKIGLEALGPRGAQAGYSEAC